MAKYGGDVFSVLATTVSSTGTFNDISNYITDFSGWNLEALTQPGTAFGDSWEETLYTGMRRANQLTLKGFYDDAAATGPHAIFGALAALGAERVVKLKFGTTNEYPKVDVIVQQYNRKPSVGQLTEFELVLMPTGAVTLATT